MTIAAILFLALAIETCGLFMAAPWGWEDADGFHYGKPGDDQ